MVLSAQFSESTSMPTRKAAAAAKTGVREIQNEENMYSSVNKSNDDAAPTAAHPAVKANRGSRKKAADTTAQTVVTVGAVDHPHSFLKVIRKHFLKYITTDEVALRLLMIHEVLDDILREHSIQLGNKLLDADNISSESKEIITPWLELFFLDSFAIAKDIDPRKDVICGPNRPSRTLTSKPFIEIVKQNSHHGNGKQTRSIVVEQIVEQLFEKGIRFLLYMAVGIHYILDKRDPDVKERVRKALENQQKSKRSQSKKKGTKPFTAAAAAARASTSPASGAKTKSRARREGRPCSYEDPDESPPLIKSPKLEHNPDLTDIKIGAKIAVYWPGDQCYYGGEVTKYRQGENGERTSFCIDYDDGQDEWIDLRRHSFMVQSYGDSDSESLASTTISSGASDNRDLSELVEVKSVSCSGPSEVKTNLVIKFCSDEEDLSNLAAGKSVGFIIGLSLQSTFVALREAIDTNNLEGLPPAGTWKFFIPNLAVMSSDQESVFTVGSLPYLGDDNPRVIYVCRP